MNESSDVRISWPQWSIRLSLLTLNSLAWHGRVWRIESELKFRCIVGDVSLEIGKCEAESSTRKAESDQETTSSAVFHTHSKLGKSASLSWGVIFVYITDLDTVVLKRFLRSKSCPYQTTHCLCQGRCWFLGGTEVPALEARIHADAIF